MAPVMTAHGRGERGKSSLLQSDYLVHRNSNMYLILSKFCMRGFEQSPSGVKREGPEVWTRAFLPKWLR